jgi:hypothetical protein
VPEPLDYRSPPSPEERPPVGGNGGRLSFASSTFSFMLLAICGAVIALTERHDAVRDLVLMLAGLGAVFCSLIAVIAAAVGIWEGGTSRRWSAASLAVMLVNGAMVVALVALIG